MRVAVGDVWLYFDVDGPAIEGRPAVVLLHGGPGADHSVFKPEFDALTDVAQVVYLDQRGSGRSDRGEPADWTWPRWADDVAGFCGAVGLDRVVLLGSSSGAMVAMACAARHKGLVAGLVLESPLGAPTTLEESLAVFERRGGPAAREAASRYLGGDTSPDAARAWQEHALPLYGGDVLVRRARARINDEVQDHFRRGGCGPADAAEYTGDIGCPTLILAGEDDPVSPAVGARRLADALGGGVRVEVLPGVGHGVFRQAPDEAFSLLRRFLRDLSGRPQWRDGAGNRGTPGRP